MYIARLSGVQGYTSLRNLIMRDHQSLTCKNDRLGLKAWPVHFKLWGYYTNHLASLWEREKKKQPFFFFFSSYVFGYALVLFPSQRTVKPRACLACVNVRGHADVEYDPSDTLSLMPCCSVVVTEGVFTGATFIDERWLMHQPAER